MGQIVREFNISFYGLNDECHNEIHVSPCMLCQIIADPPFRYKQIIITRCDPYPPIDVKSM